MTITQKLITGGISLVVAASAAGILSYQIGYDDGLAEGRKVLPIGTEKILTAAYNQILDGIKDNCENDDRCVYVNGTKSVKFENIGSIKENFVKVMGDYADGYDIKIIKKVKIIK